MRGNPEFVKNLWLELTPYRLIGMPVVIASVLYLAYLTDGREFSGAVASAACTFFVLITIVWGTKQAAETIMNEIREHTWDGQRMSVLTPWQLVWGKLFGSTVYTWYGSLICLLAFALAVPDKTAAETGKIVLSLFLVGLLSHSVSLLACLLSIQKERKYLKAQTTAILLLGIIVAVPLLNLVMGRQDTVTWYGRSYVGTDFVLCTLAAYAAWAGIGMLQLMRRELQMKNTPVAWYGFVLFLMTYCGGFFQRQSARGADLFDGVYAPVLTAFYVVVGLTYSMAFAERKDLLSLQRVVSLVGKGEWGRFLQRAPCWLLTLPTVVLTGIVLAGSTSIDVPGALPRTACFVTAGIAFLGRDLGILLFCNLAEKNRRADLLAVLYLLLLYGVIPAILEALHMPGATVLFWPRTDQSLFLLVAAPILELLLVLYLLSARWSNRTAETAV